MGKDIFKRIAGSQSSGGGNFIKQGKGTLIIKNVKLPNLYNGDTFIAEFQVKASESYPDAVDKAGKPESANAPGTGCSYVQQLEKFESAPGNVKAFVEKLVGNSDLSDDDFVGLLKEVVNEDPNAKDDDGQKLEVNPMRGHEIGFETYQKPIQKGPNAGKMITLIRWEHLETDDATVQANRDALDGKTSKAA
jgi:hypothetical protein